MALVSQVEVDDISCEKPPHAPGQRLVSRPDEKMKMAGRERPAIHNQSPSLTKLP